MFSYIALALVGLVAYAAVQHYRSFLVNLAAAKQSGLKYIRVPIFSHNVLWLLTHRLWLPMLRRLPPSWTTPWLEYANPEYVWLKGYRPFEEVGDDIFLIASPGQCTLNVADPEAVTQIVNRRNDFPKPTWMYRSIDIFGPNVISAEGALWRHHRKITSPPFTEKNNRLVWNESLHQARGMLAGWISPDQTSSGPILDVAHAGMTLSLHVISKAGFGVRLLWPHEEGAKHVPPGHTLSYKDALEALISNMIVVMLTPTLILKNSPLEMHKKANEAYIEWGNYMREIYEAKKEEAKKGESREGLDLMGALVKGAGISQNADKTAPPANKQLLTDEEILGNAFVFILAGHETAANTIHFSLMYLAMHPQSQRRLQKDLDAILGDRSADKWSFDDDIPKLLGGMCGAVMAEELRLIPPVVAIPKCTRPGEPQGLQVAGRHITVPANTNINIDTVALGRNPKYWPHTSTADLEDFRPERWLLQDGDHTQHQHTEEDTYTNEPGLDVEGPDKRPDTSASLFRPVKGAYVPFSDGWRSCLGRRFAQVEIAAVLATLFKTHSVELDVSMFMSDEELKTATPQQKREAWNKADARVRSALKTAMETRVTIQMRHDKVPMRFVKRGYEQFDYAV